MRIHSYRFCCLSLLILCILCCSCGKTKEPEPDFSNYEQYNFQSIADGNIKSYAINAEGDFLVCTADGKLASYGRDGEKLTSESQEGVFYGCLCYDGEKLYAYDEIQSAIVELTGGASKIIHNSLPFHTIRNMVALDGKLYLLAVLQTEENKDSIIPFGSQSFEDYGQAVYCINIEDGKYQELPLEHITAEYRSETGNLYFYGWQEDKYYLYEYNPKKNKIANKQSCDGMDNFISLVVEEKRLFGVTPSGLAYINLETKENEMLMEGLYTPSGSLMQFSKGNLFLYEPRQEAILHAAFLEQDGMPTLLAKNTAAEEEPAVDAQLPKRTETITVSQPFSNILKPMQIKSLCGMSTKMIEQPLYDDTLITELMAGNENIDIYLLSSGYGLTRVVQEMEYYVPLNDSKIITEYLDRCFDVFQEAAAAKNGDIWMLPFTGSVMTTWYVPENMELFGLTEENLDTVEHYLDTLEQLHGKLGDYRFYNYTSRFITFCDWQYDMLYNDPDNGIIDFQTETYRNLMEPLWTGWVRSTGYAEHPLFFSDDQEISGGHPPAEGYTNVRSRILFKTDWLSMVHPFSKEGALEGWRVMAGPKINEPSEKQAAAIFYAFVNPYSKQKEAAIAYLEAIATDPLNTVANPGFFLRNPESYADIYDITQPAFSDLLEIFENLGAVSGYTLNTAATDIDYITPYQEGKITIEQALEQRQKRAISWLEE